MTLGDCTEHVETTVRNLGGLRDSHLSVDAHISAIVRSFNFHLYELARVCCCISVKTCRFPVLALVISRLDYYNALLVGASQHQLDKLQRLQDWWIVHAPRAHYPHPVNSYTGFLHASGFSTNFVC